MKQNRIGCVTVAWLWVVLSPQPTEAQGRVSVEAFLGGAHNFGTTLSVEQNGQPELEVSADYETRPFEPPLYYAIRISFQEEARSWEIQFIHHKLYLTNGPPEVEHFEITHGFNTLTFGHAWTSLPVTVRLGGGLVIAHPDSEIRGMSWSPGYEVTGPAVFAGVGKRFPLGTRVFLSTEAQFLWARAHVSVSGGEASAPNVALHGLIGLGFGF
jgi:hypothetical protein